MVMALSLFQRAETLTLVAGYENGLATVAHLNSSGNWTISYQAQSHSQPILSLDVSPNLDYFLTSSADSIIVKHPLPSSPLPLPHPQPPTQIQIQTIPLKTTNTKHAGQQSLRIRSDARIFATAGWDAKVRVYSAKTLAEVAVLKWHAVGCYAVGFAGVDTGAPVGGASGTGEDAEVKDEDREGNGEMGDRDGKGEGDEGAKSLVAVPRLVDMTVRERRVRQARMAHWLVAGSKDGKVSLWDVF
jgi:WD40 repeat protein